MTPATTTATRPTASAQPTVERTPTRDHAETLIAIGRHLATHDHLIPVTVCGPVDGVCDTQLWDWTCRGRVAAALADWADSLDDVMITAQTAYWRSLDAAISVVGVCGGQRIRVWGHVSGMSTTLGLPHPQDQWHTVPVIAEQLRACTPAPAEASAALATELVPPPQQR